MRDPVPSPTSQFDLRLLFVVVSGVAAVTATLSQLGTLWGFVVALVAFGFMLSLMDRIVWPAVAALVFGLILAALDWSVP